MTAAADVNGTISPDGRHLSFLDWQSGDLMLRDLRAGTDRRLTGTGKWPASNEYAEKSAISKDGGKIAYAWFNEAGFYDLRVVPTAGGEPRPLYRNEEAGFVQPTSWTPDGKHILTLFFRKDNISQIALVDAESGTVRVLKSLNWVYPKRMEISPDGRWIVYDSFPGDKPAPRDIYLLALDGSRETKLVDSPGEDLFPAWSPRGDEVVFPSLRARGFRLRHLRRLSYIDLSLTGELPERAQVHLHDLLLDPPGVVLDLFSRQLLSLDVVPPVDLHDFLSFSFFA